MIKRINTVELNDAKGKTIKQRQNSERSFKHFCISARPFFSW